MINLIFIRVFYLFISTLYRVTAIDENLIHHFKESKLVPDLIPEAPTELCNITYPVYGFVEPGSVLNDEQSFDEPIITWNADPNCIYTLYWAGIASQTLVGTREPDLVNSSYEDRIKTEYSLMLIVNIPGNNYSAGLPLSSYTPPGDPPVKKCLYKEFAPSEINYQIRDRYAILIYKQKDIIVPPTKKYDEYEFQAFTPLIKFIRTYNLIGPVAGNVFYTKKDDDARI